MLFTKRDCVLKVRHLAANCLAGFGIFWLGVNGNPRYVVFVGFLVLSLVLTSPSVVFEFIQKCFSTLLLFLFMVGLVFFAGSFDSQILAHHFALLLLGSFIIAIRLYESRFYSGLGSELSFWIGLNVALLLFGILFFLNVPIEKYVRPVGAFLYRDNSQDLILYKIFIFPNVIMGFIPFVHIAAGLFPLCFVSICPWQRFLLLASFCYLVLMCSYFVTRTPIFVAFLNVFFIFYIFRKQLLSINNLKVYCFTIIGFAPLLYFSLIFYPPMKGFLQTSLERFIFRQGFSGLSGRPDLILEAANLVFRHPLGDIRKAMFDVPYAHFFILDAALDWGILFTFPLVFITFFGIWIIYSTWSAGRFSLNWLGTTCVFIATLFYGFSSPFTDFFWVLFFSTWLYLYVCKSDKTF